MTEDTTKQTRAVSGRITLVIHSLDGGGSEHVAAWMASQWADSGRQVTLITLDSVSKDRAFVSPAVRRIGLDLMRTSPSLLHGLLANRIRIRRLRQSILESQPDVVISLTDRTNVLTLLACRRTGHRPIVAERTDFRHHRIGRLWEGLRRWTYPRARGIVVQTEAVADAIRSISGSAPVSVIPNAVEDSSGPVQTDASSASRDTDSSEMLQLDHSSRWICGLGRLSFEKGFDRLIKAFALASKNLTEWRLVLVGDGPERSRLEALTIDLGIESRVQFAGWHEQPWPGLTQADIFVLPSRYEGFPNALLEAMARGLACIAVDCESGPGEIIRDNVDGRLVPPENLDALAQALGELMTDGALRRRLGQQAVEVCERYSVEQFFERWDAFITETAEAG